MFEPLEPRLLLSADPLFAYTASEESDLLLRIEEDAGVATLQLIDQSEASPAIISQQVLQEGIAGEILVTGSSLNDTLPIDQSVLEQTSLVVSFDGGLGADTLAGPDAGAR